MNLEKRDPELEDIRLQKYLALCSLGSRRDCEKLIEEGRVEVDGALASDLGTRINAYEQKVKVDGSRVRPELEKVVLALNKPKNVLSAMEDKSSRLTLSDILTYKSRARLFHVGRLDYDSEGLLLMTNDGTLANRLSHPRYGVEKNYMVFLNHPLPQNVASMLVSRGVLLEDGWQKFDKVKILRQGSHKCEVMVSLHSGKNRIVRRVFAALGFRVEKLVRTRMGPVSLGGLKPGEYRKLDKKEIEELEKEVGFDNRN
ncbi:MAG: rRNA pseudouridine synthase [Aeriscardovia sp.]|nr:rRNA pseudouridine synthase [Aeriscardovia sp.]MBO6018916.1 rRNA pseudouridine synthase [Aeriscardovia sp.]MBO6049887.1 rRNA pseudouridine synthase [Aeriscardovia sp.]